MSTPTFKTLNLTESQHQLVTRALIDFTETDSITEFLREYPGRDHEELATDITAIISQLSQDKGEG